MTSGLSTILADLERELAALDPGDLPAAIGELARLQAQTWARLAAPSPGNGHTVPEEDLQLFTLPQVAKLFGIPEGHAYELARRGELPTIKIGRYVRARRRDIERWLTRKEKITCAPSIQRV